ncbi:MAG: alkaline phosphatase D family protein, partial [Planctomycetota bacterium]|nr:alkaline phosphatase D family protein [Planctomycetota bacterium]
MKTLRSQTLSQMEFDRNRRWFLSFTSSLPLMAWSTARAATPFNGSYQDNPFTLGVASGDPDHRGMVLWTRLAPKPLEPGGGMPAQPVNVTWEVATDADFKQMVQSGVTTAIPQLGHSVHVELQSLKPDRWYWYRFRSGNAESRVGKTRTLPHPESLPARLKFAVTSCQNYEQGLYTAYEQMAKDEPDLVFHLGDYIYEYGAGRSGKVRSHIGNEIVSLEDYRIRYAQYRSDRLLQNMHAQCPWLVTWDDHEFDNNCANQISEEPNIDPAEFLRRRANAYQAYYEMMPLRSHCKPRGSDMRLYRSAAFGRLATFNVLDTRQYRSDQPNGDRHSPLNSAAMDPAQTLLGKEQKRWLQQKLSQSKTTWNVLAQQVMMGLVDRNANPLAPKYSMDQWPGYTHERMKLMEFIRDRSVSNPVVFTGDIHTNWANELRIDDRDTEQPTLGTEFVCSSLSSGGNGIEKPGNLNALLSANPFVKYHNAERGYIRCEMTPKSLTADYLVVDDVLKPGGNTFRR